MKRSYAAYYKSSILDYIKPHVRSLSQNVFNSDSSGIYTCYKCGYTSNHIGTDLDIEYRKTADNFDYEENLFGSFISQSNVINLCANCIDPYKRGLWEIYNGNSNITINNLSMNASGTIS